MSYSPNKPTNLAVVVTSAFLFSLTPGNALASTTAAPTVMPISFEHNEGQAPANVRFISRGASGVLFLSPSEITLRTPSSASQLRLKLRGAAETTEVVGSGEPSGMVNYFRGQDSSKWLTSIPSYTQVTYKSVYPHIDLVVYGNNRQFESDFVIERNADPSAISLEIDGKLNVQQDGSLSIQSAGGAFKLHRPFVYQVAENGERVAINSRYTVGHGNTVGFALGQYDRSKSLVIDPVLSYSTYLGGSSDEQILGISGDLLGSVYVTGLTTSLDFPTSHPLQAKNNGNTDCFVAKFDPTGQHLLYSTYLGGSNFDKCTTVAVNLLGEAFVGGTTFSSDFPTHNPLQASLKGTQTGFVAHLDCTGSKLIFSTYLGGGGEFVTGVALDLLSNVYVTGLTNSLNFPVTKGAFQTACGTPCLINAFVSKISPDGSRLVFSSYLGGSSYDSANGIAVDLTGSAYVTGEAHSVNFPTKNAYQPTYGGGIANGFVTKFSPDGSSLVYSTYVGGSTYDSARSIAVDLFGYAYVTGVTQSPNFPTVNAVQAHLKGAQNIFAFRLSNKGTALNYSTYIGGSKSDYAFGISVDLWGNAIVAGQTTSPDFPVQAAIQPTFGGGTLDSVVVSFNPKGALNYSTFLGGSGDDYSFAIYSDLFGCVWVGGQTTSANYPVTATALQGSIKGGSDASLSRITQ